MNYICEKAARRQGCSFRTGKVILQRAIERDQVQKLLATGRTDLLEKFISKKGKPFKAYLVVGEGGKVGFEFEARAEKKSGPAKPREPAAKLDLTGAEAVAKCPSCGGRVLDTATHYVCEKSQAAKKPCKFKAAKVIAQQPLEREQLVKLVTNERTDLLPKFISKRGLPFSAYLVLDDDQKITFEFPPREN
jgi:DNA topoisomerase-3